MRGTQVAVMSLIDVVDRLDTDRIKANNHLIMAMISLNDGDTGGGMKFYSQLF